MSAGGGLGLPPCEKPILSDWKRQNGAPSKVEERSTGRLREGQDLHKGRDDCNEKAQWLNLVLGG